MILSALAQYYEALNAQGKIARPGWAMAKVSYALSLSEEGELLQVIPVLEEKERGKKTVLVPREMEVPQPTDRSSGILPRFLCDNTSYILGMPCKGKAEKAQSCFVACAQLHREMLTGVESPAAKAIVAFFDKWKPEKAEVHPALQTHWEALMQEPTVVFRVQGDFVQNDLAVRKQWQAHYDASEGEKQNCLVTGKPDVPARLHPKLKGIRGAQAMGVSLVSYNARAHESYGKEQGANAPVGEAATVAYGAALNYLLSDNTHVQCLGDTTLVFWAKGGQQALQDMCAAFLGDDQAVSDLDLKAAMMNLANGKRVTWAEEEVSPDTEFYILGLSPNAGRASVRLFLRDRFGAFAQRMLEHQHRLDIVRPAYDTRAQLSVWSLLRETVNMNSREKAPSSILAGELLNAILSGNRYPATLLNGVMLRIRAEREVTRGRAAIIKAYYLKNPHPECPKEVLTVELNESKNIPYRLGRAFSILEAIQEAANPGINATIKDKYFNSASATPDRVFPVLINLAQKHLRKLEGGKRVYFEKQLQEIVTSMEIEKYPVRLTLPEQGSFQLGYYHQQQKRYEKKGETENV